MYGGILVRANLEPESFPPCSLYSGRTVLVGRGDLRFPGDRASGKDSAERYAPQVIYGENFLPTSYGIASAGYISLLPPVEGSSEIFRQKFEARDDSGGRLYIGLTKKGFYWADANKIERWRPLLVPLDLQNLDDFSDRNVSVAYVEGVTYVFVSKFKCYSVNFSDHKLEEVTLTGIDTARIKGICSGANYLVAYDNATVYWGAADDIEDFTPDIETGADATVPIDLRGQIMTCVSIPQGFLIYTNTNCVAASFSGNLSSPWIFKEVPGSAGVVDVEHVTSESNFAEHISWTTSGLMQINRIESKLIHPEVNEFLAGRVLEIPSTKEDDVSPTLLRLGNSMRIKIQLISSRYLVISYGLNSLTQALIYDQLLRRWGRLNIEHVDVFEVVASGKSGKCPWTSLRQTSWASLRQASWDDFKYFPNNLGTPQHNLGFLKSDGEVVVVNTDESNLDRVGMIAIGKLRFSRDSFVEVQRFLLDYINKLDGFMAYASVSYDGLKREPPVPLFKYESGNSTSVFLTDVTGYDVILYLKGVFNLNNLEFSILQKGRQ